MLGGVNVSSVCCGKVLLMVFDCVTIVIIVNSVTVVVAYRLLEGGRSRLLLRVVVYVLWLLIV